MVPTVTPQHVANNGLDALRTAIAHPERMVIEPKVDGVRGLVVYRDDRTVETRNRHGVRRDWLRGDDFEAGLRRLADRLPLLWSGMVLDGEMTTGRFATTCPRSSGPKRHRADLRFVAFDVPATDWRRRPIWTTASRGSKRDRMAVLMTGHDPPPETREKP
jgi:ATP-dependent DNA ligase